MHLNIKGKTFFFEKNIIIFGLSGLTILAWIITIDNSMKMTSMDVILYLSIWVAMMVAMMFPSASPMILTFSHIYTNQKKQGRAFVPTWVFVSGYLLVWLAFGLAAYAASVVMNDVLLAQLTKESTAAFLGFLFIAAGLYQNSRLKNVCLSKCRTPFDFIMSSWRDGYKGSFVMGLNHGLYCFGCCWLLFLILFPLGIMNIAAMALIALLIFAEKTLTISRHVSVVAGIIFVLYGVFIFLQPYI